MATVIDAMIYQMIYLIYPRQGVCSFWDSVRNSSLGRRLAVSYEVEI